MPPDSCPDPDTLAAFHEGRLAPAAIDRVTAHLDGCSACEARLDVMERATPGPVAEAVRGSTNDDYLPPPPPGVGAGAVVGGRYKLVEVLGEGGMGTVWMAQQAAPVRRAVAVKLVKPGMDSKHVLARFEAERQALALMDHPNIARVLDAGATPDGRPFFAMELVRGVPITEFCDHHRLTPRERLALFVPVCQAVQHAHQKGVIHRDLKPNNVLVAQYDGVPVPKVIDFGVAKAAGQPLTDRTLMTGFGAVVGTPEYMSPEQATFNAMDVDTRTDVYSLGVLLYELLTGSPPLARKVAEATGLLEALRLVREHDPPRPSSTLGTAAHLPALAAARGTDPRGLARLVRGELDWIVLKALEKDRGRRYPTVNELAADIERYLAGEPVRAAPPSAWYRVRKFARRYRGPVAAALLVLLALVAGVVGTTIGLIRAEDARQKAVVREAQADAARARAVEEKAAAESLAAFLHYDILRQADVRHQAVWRDVVDPDLSVREVLDRAAVKLDTRTDLTRRSESLIRLAIGDTYVAVGRPDDGVRHLDRSWQLLVADPGYGPGHRESVFGMYRLAEAHRLAGRPSVALPLAREAMALALALQAREPDALQEPWLAMLSVGHAHQAAGQADQAVRLFEQADEWAATKYPVGRASGRLLLGEAYRVAGRPETARKVLEDLLAIPDPDDLKTARCQAALGQALLDLREWAAAEGHLSACLATRRRREPKSWTTPHSASLLGAALAGRGEYDRAEPLLKDGFREMKDRQASIPPAARPNLAAAADRLVALYTAWGKPAEANTYRAERATLPPAADR